jgi:multidrug efflux pump subunit AcrB
MSLTGIILAIGVIVDDTIVMVENSYRHLADETDPGDEAGSPDLNQLPS